MTGSGEDETAAGPAAPDPADVAPVDNDGVRTVLVGTIVWAIALVVLLVFREQLEETGRGWWIWTGVAGVGLGLLGYEYTRRRRDAIARVRQYRTDEPDDQKGRSASDS